MATSQRSPSLSLYVANIVYGPSTVAYGFLVMGDVWLALVLYFLCMSAAMFTLKLFRTLNKWPTISKIALFASPQYIASGLLFPIDALRYWVVLPVILYTGISIVGGVALRRTNIQR